MKTRPIFALFLLLPLVLACVPIANASTSEIYIIQGSELIGHEIIDLANTYYNATVTFDCSHLDLVTGPATNADGFIYCTFGTTAGNGFGFAIKQDHTTGDIFYQVDSVATWTSFTDLTAYKNITTASGTLPTFRMDYKDNSTARFYRGATGSLVHTLTYPNLVAVKLDVHGSSSDAAWAGYVTVTVRNYSSTAGITSIVNWVLPIVFIVMALGLITKYSKN